MGPQKEQNQTVKIALRYYAAALNDLKGWPDLLPRLSQTLLNATSKATNLSPTELISGFKTRASLDLAAADEAAANHPRNIVDDANITIVLPAEAEISNNEAQDTDTLDPVIDVDDDFFNTRKVSPHRRRKRY